MEKEHRTLEMYIDIDTRAANTLEWLYIYACARACGTRKRMEETYVFVPSRRVPEIRIYSPVTRETRVTGTNSHGPLE